VEYGHCELSALRIFLLRGEREVYGYECEEERISNVR
jgi:hypothetical protein